MTTFGQSGIDILCDAAANSSSHAPPTQAAPVQLPPARSGNVTAPQLPHLPQPTPAPAPAPAPSLTTGQVKQSKRKHPSSPRSTPPSHVCHICARVYERADHLTRHLRAHENARPYQCTRCPKRFNRADLLTRHEATHDRDGSDSGRASIRRSDRASEACVHCASSKAKCEDEKPCTRCRTRNLVCEMPTKRFNQLRTPSSYATAVSTPESTSSMTVGPEIGAGSSSLAPQYDAEMDTDAGSASFLNGSAQAAASNGRHLMQSPVSNPISQSQQQQQPIQTSGALDSTTYFNPSQSAFQNLDFSAWDLNFDDIPVPQYEPFGPSPSTGSNASKASGKTVMRDPARGHEAFKRSPWLWEPSHEDYIRRATEDLNVSDDITRGLRLERVSKELYPQIRMDSSMRDKLFALVLSQNKDTGKIPSFPSLGLLNYILLMHFTQEARKFDTWIHVGSFDPASSLPIFVAALVANGAIYVSAPAIWQFGMALHEVVRIGIGHHIENRNLNTRDLTTLQTFLINLDIGLWSGFQRKMEISESFLLPLVTMIRRAGRFSLPPDSPDIVPMETDTAEILDQKWRTFINRESYKRLVLHAYFHDAQSSMSLCKHPAVSFTELWFSLPASRDLWMARTAEQWRDIYLAKASSAPPADIPNISEAMHHRDLISMSGALIDKEISYAALLYGFRAQVSSYWESTKFYSAGRQPNAPLTNYPPWVQMQYQTLYRDLNVLANHAVAAVPHSRHLALTTEIMMMTTHVSLDDLQKFAGKAGEDEANRVSDALDQYWATTPIARHAVWHAGQVFRHASLLPPTTLRDFAAVAVYYASLTLWIYGLLRPNEPGSDDLKQCCVPVNGEETPQTREFIVNGGVPGLRVGDVIEPISKDGIVLSTARSLLRSNFPVQEEALPPLVESLSRLMWDLVGDGKVL